MHASAQSNPVGSSRHGLTLLAPAGLLGYAWVAGDSGFWTLGALIWVAHIGMDRLFGYGLKYSSGFRHTHLTPKGRRPSSTMLRRRASCPKLFRYCAGG